MVASRVARGAGRFMELRCASPAATGPWPLRSPLPTARFLALAIHSTFASRGRQPGPRTRTGATVVVGFAMTPEGRVLHATFSTGFAGFLFALFAHMNALDDTLHPAFS